jgi:gliding motility-associated-like protein
LFSGEQCATVSDPQTGSLLFYSDGLTVWGPTNQPMPNGTGLIGGLFKSSCQGPVIVPFPENPNKYFIFTIDELEFDAYTGLHYSVVDMTLNGGLGDVEAANKNILLTPDSLTEKITVIRSEAIRGYWVIAHRINSNEFLAYKVTGCGVSQTPVVSAVGSPLIIPFNDLNDRFDGYGSMKANPAGTRIGMPIDGSTTIEFFDFNPATGQLSNPISLEVTDNTVNPTPALPIRKYGCCFSPDGSKFYFTNTISVYQLDLSVYNATAIAASNSLIGTPANADPTFQIEQGPNGKLYVAVAGNSLAAINFPNNAGLTCGYVDDAISLNGLCLLGLPARVPDRNFAAPPISLDYDCATLEMNASIEGVNDAGINWNMGVPNSSLSGSAIAYTYADSGTVTISASISNDCYLFVADTTVFIEDCSGFFEPTCDVYEFTGSVQQWTVPAGVDSISVKMWGAAGGGGPDATNNWGGGGGYTEASIPVTPGQVIDIYVGGGGQAADQQAGGAGGWPNGGNGGSGNRIEGVPLGAVGGSGGGGGRSEIRIGGVTYAIAGGGGGGTLNRSGGYGGGLNAEYTATTNSFSVNGFGGTQTTGGGPGANEICGNPVSGIAGSALQGGDGATDLGGEQNDRASGGGGGDGYFGGGGGSSHDGCFGVGSAGGGGSGYICTGCVGVTGTTITQVFFPALPGTPANETDPLLTAYPTVGLGTQSENGGPGLVQICYAIGCASNGSTITASSCSNYVAPDGTVLTQSGVYPFTFINAGGCDSVVTLNLTVYNPPPLEALPVLATITLGDTIQLSASGGEIYSWSPTESLSCADCAAPLAFPTENIIYTVTVTDSLGCVQSDTLRIEVDIICNEVFIPTIFSPNGKGPQANETFCVFSDCVEQFKMVIHNRWGEKVFETEDISQCWDGTYKGVEANTCVYAFTVYLKQLDGTVVNKIGNISLVR